MFALERDVPLYGYGSMTFQSEPQERGIEPDECYVVGKPQTEGYPDLAIEVTVTTGGIEKLEVYRGLGVREVWIWEEGKIEVFVLGAGGYAKSSASTVIAGIDLLELAKWASDPDQHAALKAYRDGLRSR